MNVKLQAAAHLFVVLSLLLLTASEGRAQEVQRTRRQAGAAGSFALGREAFEAEAYEAAAKHFEDAVSEEGTYGTEQGAAAYWLGLAYGKQEQPQKQLRAWEEGLAVWRKAGRFSFQMAGAYLQSLPAASIAENPEAAQRTYRRLLHYIDAELSPRDKREAAVAVEQLAPLLPGEVRRQVVAGPWEERPEDPAAWQFRQDAGSVLRAWWRRQDPFPVEPGNERLAEHLRRVAYAREQYGYDERLSGYDDRGRVFVQYGAPTRRTEVEIDDPGRTVGAGIDLPPLERLRFNTPAVSNANFPPPNELWLYRQIDESGYYLFVKKTDHFRLGRVADLVPRRLQSVLPRGDGTRAAAGFQALLSIYEELSLEHSDFLGRYAVMNNFTPEQQSLQPFMKEQFSRAQLADRRARKRREQRMPRQHSTLGTYMQELPMAMRTARFLDEDGRTRTEVYWRPRAAGLGIGAERRTRLADAGVPVGEDALLRLKLAHQRENYLTHEREAKSYLIEGALIEEGATSLPVQTTTVREDDRLFHLALQWSQYGVQRTQQGSVRQGPLVRRTVRRVDSLTALPTDRLAMSDLRPVSLLEEQLAGIARPAEETRAHVYLSDTLAAGTPLALYFEVYNLTYGPDDQTRYTVAYEVQRRTERGGIAGFFRGDREARTSTEATYASDARRAEEFILLNLEQEHAESGVVGITVRITDEVTKQQVERFISFEIPEQ